MSKEGPDNLEYGREVMIPRVCHEWVEAFSLLAISLCKYVVYDAKQLSSPVTKKKKKHNWLNYYQLRC
ncbi:hypothetical protein MTR_5g036510 [Medicago truncatula]|uniref:Uncharacterized protein n=1 Tax=Medicago truncatula TaxID=3880 RepID=G7K5M0_MEDTR|nr:hypothetical protein MTR_5g036510 [Medicago truncatula]